MRILASVVWKVLNLFKSNKDKWSNQNILLNTRLNIQFVARKNDQTFKIQQTLRWKDEEAYISSPMCPPHHTLLTWGQWNVWWRTHSQHCVGWGWMRWHHAGPQWAGWGEDPRLHSTHDQTVPKLQDLYSQCNSTAARGRSWLIR